MRTINIFAESIKLELEFLLAAVLLGFACVSHYSSR